MSEKNRKDLLAQFGQEPLENPNKTQGELATAVADQPITKELNQEPVAIEDALNEEAPYGAVKRGRGRPAKKLVNAIRAQRKKGVLIPEKLYFAISEVAEICGVKPYVLRYWESEFKLLRPSKNPSGQRMYQRKDIDMVFKIKKYLYDEGFTISGAKKRLKDDRKAGLAPSKEMLSKIKGELSDILKSVKK